MREDMDKVIVERPRRVRGLGKEKYGRRKNLSFDDLPSKEGLRRFKLNRKYPNENLSPLKRFLERSVGRPWDNVFSEICEHINVNSAIQAHIKQHIFDFVADQTFIKDGKVWRKANGSWLKESPIEDDTWHILFVHPVDGLLKRIVRPKGWIHPLDRNQPSAIAKSEPVDGPNGTQYHKLNGIWFAIALKSIPKKLSVRTALAHVATPHLTEAALPTADGLIRDVLLERTLYDLCVESPKQTPTKWHHRRGLISEFKNLLHETYGRPGVYGASLKQMNSKELKTAGLKNDAPAV